MAYRIFKDSRGREWQTWDVVPRLGERRATERRVASIPTPHSDRRSRSDDRRVITGQRAVLTRGMDTGWLCFEAPAEKRRLAPIPDDWMRCAVERLEQYCAKAAPARASVALTPVVDADG